MNKLLPERELFRAAQYYELSFEILTQMSLEKASDSIATLILAICSNLCALFLELGNLPKVAHWRNRLLDKNVMACLRHQQTELGSRNQGQLLKCIHITASVHGVHGARAA